MKVKAVYHQEVHDDGHTSRVTHAVDHDSGGFMVSSEAVGIAVQNFLNAATASDIAIVQRHLLYAFKDAWNEESKLPLVDSDEEAVKQL